jgi:hypothetical protein
MPLEASSCMAFILWVGGGAPGSISFAMDLFRVVMDIDTEDCMSSKISLSRITMSDFVMINTLILWLLKIRNIFLMILVVRSSGG